MALRTLSGPEATGSDLSLCELQSLPYVWKHSDGGLFYEMTDVQRPMFVLWHYSKCLMLLDMPVGKEFTTES